MILLVLGAMDYGSPPTKPQPLPVARASAQIEPATNDMPMDDASPLDEHEVGAEHTLPHAFSGLESDEERQSEFDILWKADKEWWNYPSTVRGCMRASYVRNQLATYKTVRDRCSEHYH